MKTLMMVLLLLGLCFVSTGNLQACDAQTLGVCNGVIGGGAAYVVQPQAVYAAPIVQQVYAQPVVQQVVAYPQAFRQNVVVGHSHAVRQNVVVRQPRANVVVGRQRANVVVRGGNRANVVVGY